MDINSRLDYYKIFYEVAKCGNLTKASEKLFISQPAISQTIKKLEEELGVVLFVRNKKGVTLTQIGKQIFEKVENALQNFLSIENLVNDEKEVLSGHLTIGGGSAITRKILCQPVTRFLRENPNIKFSHIEKTQDEMREMLLQGMLDLALSQYIEEEKNLSFTLLSQQPYLFVKGKNMDKNYKFIKMIDGSFAGQLFDKFIDEKKLHNVPTISVSGYQFCIELACQGLGITIAPLYMVQDKIDSGELEQVYPNYQFPSIDFGIYYNEKLLTPVAKRFIKYLY